MTDQIYHLSCHCQKHVMKLTFPPSANPFTDAHACNCSYCIKRRTVWGVIPENATTVVRGFGEDGDTPREYRFGAKNASHLWCGTCGSQLLCKYPEPEKPIYFNMRCVRDDHFDLWDHPLNMFNGKERAPLYDDDLTLEDLPGAKEYLEKRKQAEPSLSHTYVGSCHCKAIKFAVATPRLEHSRVNDCACSICLGNGSLWLYPRRVDTFWIPSPPSEPYRPLDEAILEYGFDKRQNFHYNCIQCGCNLLEYSPYRSRWGPIEDPKRDGGLGVNISLLSNISEYLHDIHGFGWDKEVREEDYESEYEKITSMTRNQGKRYNHPNKLISGEVEDRYAFVAVFCTTYASLNAHGKTCIADIHYCAEGRRDHHGDPEDRAEKAGIEF